MLWKQTCKKWMSAMLCLALLCSALCLPAAAGAAEKHTLKLLSYNVSGLPVVGTFQGTAFSGGNRKSAAIGTFLNKLDCDIIGVQEDFNYHKGLAEQMTAFPYQTLTSGGVPAGDGLNLFAKRPIYNVSRSAWNNCYGVISGSADRLAQKGFVYTVAEIAEGVYIDLYVVHADAGVDFKSVRARADNFRQLAEHIQARTQDRAIVALGDFNFRYARNLEDDIYQNLIVPTGLQDMWVELHNGGNYEYGDGSDWNPKAADSVDRILYKSGGGVEFTPQDFDFLVLTDESGKTHTDHTAMSGTLAYTLNNPPANAEPLRTEEPTDARTQFQKELKATLNALGLIFTNLHELFYLFDQLLIEKLGFANGIFFKAS